VSATAVMPQTANALTRDELVSICERGSWLFERSGDAFVSIDAPGADAVRARRLADWKTIIAAGDETRFARRLSWQGLDDAALRKALGPVQLRDASTLPDWAGLLGELSAEARPIPEARFFDPTWPVPFEHVMAPLVASASRRMAAVSGASLNVFDDAAIAALERALLRRLSLWMTETLHVSFGLFRRNRISALDLLFMRGAGDRSTDVYQEFVGSLLDGGLRALFLEYPAMARLVATGVQAWIAATAELVQRTAADFPGDRVLAVEALLSDSHNRGRSVSILTFAVENRRLVYKPRSVTPEAAWFRLIEWMNGHGAPETLRRLEVLERDGYGWVEVIAAAPLRDSEAAERFYRRCGLLLAVTYALGSSDMHFENLIAVGDQPVLIDMETILCHSPLETVYGVAADDLLRTVFFESPIRTGLLPRWQTGEGLPVDVSALGAVHAQKSRVPIPQWKDVNTDLMELAYETIEGFSGPNAPKLDGVALSPNEHLDAIVGGFTEGYRFLVREREQLLAGPLAGLASLQVRFIFRATSTYLMMLKGSRQPHLLRDGVERSIHLDPIAAPLLFAEERPLAWPLVELERLSMEIEDCPYFTAGTSSSAIHDPRGGAIPGILEAPCFEQMSARMQRLGDVDLENQLALVRASFDSRTQISAHSSNAANDAAAENAPPLTREELLDEAVRVADSVLARSIPGPNRAPNWVTLRYLLGIDRNQLDPIGADLFDGRAGIALLFAALQRATGETRFGEAARAIADGLRGELTMMNPELQHDLLVHGATGIASLAYVFPHLAELLDEPRYVRDASRAAQFVHDAAIAGDHRFDVLSGAAGSLLALLRLARAGDASALERAVACGDHLLAHRHVHEGLRCWRTFEERPISGFAHGNAGIAFALLRLHAAAGHERFRDAALEAIAFENTTYSPDDGNWRDLRWEQPSFAAGWCHGGPGIALSRLEAIPHDATLARDAACGASLAREHVREGTDHLCCGNFGRVLLLHDIGRRTGRPELVREAESLAAGRVARARQRGGYRFMREYAGYVSFPGLFQGTSGVSWALLRLAEGDRVPDVLRYQ
jgi:type 2 lantibiotic biosynthesis protein LanM